MNIGFVGLGKLGLPVALAVESKGHSVIGYDPDPSGRIRVDLARRDLSFEEVGANELLEKSSISLELLDTVVEESEIIFVPVQTPHQEKYDGSIPAPHTRADFNYEFLVKAIRQVADSVVRIGKPRIITIISTVLPGTVEREILPIIQGIENFKLCYNPFFIAMGTTINDFLDPEFVLLGVDDKKAAARMKEFYATIHSKPVFETAIKNAELTKVLYNTFISMKIAYANTVMEICHKVGADCDEVIDAIALADRRLMSPAYLRGGMGDGCGCHPRDNIAMSWLCEKVSLSHDLFSDIMLAREDQSGWLAQLIVEQHNKTGLPVFLYGESCKGDTNLTQGSPARLLSYQLIADHGLHHSVVDPFTRGGYCAEGPSVIFISTRHSVWLTHDFPHGAVVIDPFRYLHDNDTIRHCTYIPIGECSARS
jgi:UDPglucose 6-dehydrogenase